MLVGVARARKFSKRFERPAAIEVDRREARLDRHGRVEAGEAFGGTALARKAKAERVQDGGIAWRCFQGALEIGDGFIQAPFLLPPHAPEPMEQGMAHAGRESIVHPGEDGLPVTRLHPSADRGQRGGQKVIGRLGRSRRRLIAISPRPGLQDGRHRRQLALVAAPLSQAPIGKPFGDLVGAGGGDRGGSPGEAGDYRGSQGSP